MIESTSGNIEHGAVPYLPPAVVGPGYRPNITQAEITVPGDGLVSEDRAASIGAATIGNQAEIGSAEITEAGFPTGPTGESAAIQTSDVPSVPAEVAAQPEEIDVVQAEALLVALTDTIADDRLALEQFVDRQNAAFKLAYEDAAQSIRNEPGSCSGYFDYVASTMHALASVTPEDQQRTAETIAARLAPAIEKGRVLEPIVVAAANREIIERRTQLAAEADWDKIIDAFIDRHEEDTGFVRRAGYDGLLFSAEVMNAQAKPHTDYMRAVRDRDLLRRLSRQVAERGDTLPTDQPWQAPEGWRVSENLALETDQWTEDVRSTAKYLSSARLKVLDSRELAQVEDLAALGLRARLHGERDGTSHGVPLHLAYVLENRTITAIQRFNEADDANIAEVAATLPNTTTVIDPHGLAALVGIDDPEAWVVHALEKIPDHIKQGLGLVRFSPHTEAYLSTSKGVTLKPLADFLSEANAALLYVNRNEIEKSISLKNMLPLATAAIAKKTIRTKLAEGLRHEVMHFDHNYRTPVRTLADWSKVVAGEDTPLSDYTVMAADPELFMDSDKEEYAVAGVMYADERDKLQANGSGARYRVMDARMRNP